ncbi:hypothetical protein GW17_00008442 [Ensete ventricosum]|nr:hypothetical protein GW17_00008442 [Ensete ventricosum]
MKTRYPTAEWGDHPPHSSQTLRIFSYSSPCLLSSDPQCESPSTRSDPSSLFPWRRPLSFPSRLNSGSLPEPYTALAVSSHPTPRPFLLLHLWVRGAPSIFGIIFYVWLSVSCPFDLGVHGLGLRRVGLALGRSRSMVARSSVVAGVKSRAVAVANARDSRPIVVIDNYDSFTYNLCQVL